MRGVQPPLLYCCAVFAGLLASTISATPSHAQNGERQHSVVGTAADAATQPLEDFNLKSRKIPGELLMARGAPYEMKSVEGCAPLQYAIIALDDVLGPDADEEDDETGLMRGALKAGGGLLSGFIPFRGIVRTLSGANKKRAEMAAAVYAGVARRSYLKGYSAAKGCPTAEEAAMRSADVAAGSGTPTRDVTATKDASVSEVANNYPKSN